MEIPESFEAAEAVPCLNAWLLRNITDFVDVVIR